VICEICNQVFKEWVTLVKSKGIFGIALTVVAFSATIVAAQMLPDSIRSQVEGARLGAGYAQIINFSAAPDLRAANYTY
jgi:hypothetical protein